MKKILYSTLLTIFLNGTNAKTGKDFFLVGDFAKIKDMTNAHNAFNGMNELKKNRASECHNDVCENDIDFILTMGDNIYPRDKYNPTSDEMKEMLSLF